MLLNTLFRHWSYRLFAPGTMLRERYEALKKLLNYDILSHEQMAEFQDILHSGQPEDLVAIRKRFTDFSSNVREMVAALEVISPGSYASLKAYHKKFDFYTRFLLAPPKLTYAAPFVYRLDDIQRDNPEIGNKAKNLAILLQELQLPIPPGFVVTTGGYHYFIEYNDLRPEIDRLLAEIQIFEPANLNHHAQELQHMILQGEVPPLLLEELLTGYEVLPGLSGDQERLVAVRSSAIIEDSGITFAGQYSTVLHVDRNSLGQAYLQVLASKYSPEALFYRISHGLGDEETAMSVLVQQMVLPVASGVLYTRNVVSDSEQMQLHAVPGFGERLVGGHDNPDTYLFSREQPPVLSHCNGECSQLDKEMAVCIARYGLEIEQTLGCEQDIEWAIDQNNMLSILQARPLHVSEQDSGSLPEISGSIKLLDGCRCAAPGVASGLVYHLDVSNNLDSVPEGAVLVTMDSPPEYVRVLNRLAAVVAVHGSRASHFATVAREFGVPLLVGREKAFESLPSGELVTVDGDRGIVYSGKVEQLLKKSERTTKKRERSRILREVMKFITPLELVDAAASNFTPEGCRSMHDIIRFCHEMALQAMFATARPGTGRGALRLVADIPLDVFLFDVGGGFVADIGKRKSIPLEEVASFPFQALWAGMSHPDVQWKQKPFDWDAYDKIELAGGVPPKKDSFAFASYAAIGADYLHFNIRFGYHFTILDVLCGENSVENYCMLRFAGGGGDYDHRVLRIDFIVGVLLRLGFRVEHKGDLLEGKLQSLGKEELAAKLDMLGRLLGATKLMDMVLEDPEMVETCVDDFFNGRYSFSEQG
ncbi:PEP/pyruvate-binding domain-containing protein [Desulfogranum japonicum]|uniref:PEP/pyruvate-binding domain-containing protein n=1 Tax=Desulfogranum japonicum TaxID=231447 RepID=UPI0003FF93D7|nr:PEP/pyruvate-binding domain-containing protein [Desulfogranum japonicum]